MTPRGTRFATLVNICETGMRAAGLGELQPGDAVEFSLPHGKVIGHVRWARQGSCGLRFDAPLTAVQVDAVRRSRGKPAPVSVPAAVAPPSGRPLREMR